MAAKKTAKKPASKPRKAPRTQLELSPGPLFDALPLGKYGAPTKKPAAPAPVLDKRTRRAHRKAEREQLAAAKTHERATLKASKAQRLAEYTAEEHRLAELVKQLRGWKRRCAGAKTLEQFKALPSISASAKHHAGSIFSFKG